MILHGLKINSKITYFDRSYIILSIEPPKVVLKREETDGEVITVSFDSLVTNPSFKPTKSLLRNVEKDKKEYFSILDGLPEKKRNQVSERFKIIRPLIILEKAKNHSLSAKVEFMEFYSEFLLKGEILQDINQKMVIERISSKYGGKPSVATIKRYLKQYRDAENAQILKPEEGLISLAGEGHKYRKDCMQLVICHPKDPTLEICTINTRMSEEVAKKIKQVIEEEYLNIKKPKKSAVYRSLIVHCSRSNLTPPDKSTFFKLLSRIPINILDIMRGTIKEKEKYKDIEREAGTKEALYPLHIVEVDHTELDIEVIDEQSGYTIGRPWITLGIDVFSRTVWCLYVSLEHPSANRVRKAIQHGVLFKYSKETYNTINDWSVFGVPTIIKLDNGSDFISYEIKTLINETIKSHVRYRPVGTPSYGGTIERLFGTLNSELIHNLDGTRKSNVNDLGDYNPEKEAKLTLQDIKEILYRYITDIYHYKEHSGLPSESNIPLLRYYEGLQNVGYPEFILEEDVEEFKIDILPTILKPYTRDGIRIDNVLYKDPLLSKLIGPREVKYKLKYDNDDISKVYIFLTDENRYHEVSSVQPAFESIKGVNRFTYKKLIALLKEEGKIKRNSIPGSRDIEYAMSILAEDIEKKYKRSRKARRDAARMEIEVLAKPSVGQRVESKDPTYEELLNFARENAKNRRLN